MKRITIFAGAALLFGLCLAVAPAGAQGFSGILSKLEGVETRLDNLETAQKRDVQALRKQITSVKPGPDISKLERIIGDLRGEIDRLSGDLVHLKAQPVSTASDEKVGALTVELRGMIGDLRDNAGKYLASSGPAPMGSGGAVGTAPDLNISVEAGVDVYSQYVWRGFRLADKASVQPTVTFGFGDSGVALNVWGSAAIQKRNAPASLEEADELDFTLSYDGVLGGEDSQVGVSLGYIQYTFPNLTGTKHSEEVYAGLSLDHPLAPSLTTYYDFGLADAWYVTAGIGPELALTETTSLGLGASVGLSDAARSFGFNDFTVSASLGTTFNALTLSPTIGYSYADDAVNGDNGEIWGGLSLSISH